MIIKEFKFSPFNIKLKEPLQNSSFKIESREGFIIKITDENNLSSYGEVSPLLGFSIETIDECDVALNKLYYSIIDKARKKEEFDLTRELEAVSNLPSLRFGIEQAIISLLIKRGELNSLLSTEKQIAVNGLVGIKSEEKVLKKVDDLLADGFKTIKIKVGVNSVEDDIKLVNKISTRIDNSIKIRLDVNGSWNYQQTEYAINNLQKEKLELIEQPVKDINELVMLSDFSPIPIGVDESIKTISDATDIVQRSNIKVIVLKPSILGSIIQTISLIKTAEQLGKKIIISSAFESVVGRSALFMLASLVNGNYAHGLNTASYLDEVLTEDVFLIENGKVLFNPKEYPPKFTRVTI
jgi:o-succinylbenzoate synthase